jgi:hypothetical protein
MPESPLVMDIQAQPPSLSFVAAASARWAGACPDCGEPWPGLAAGAGPPPGRPRVRLLCGLAREGADLARTLRLVDLACEVFDAAGVESEVLDLSGLTADGSRRTPPFEGRVCTAEGVLILLPAHWRRMSAVLQLTIDHGEWGVAAEPGRAYGLVVQGDLRRSLQVRRALCDRLDSIGLIDACEQARLEHFLGCDEPCLRGMPPEGEAALEGETRAAAGALVQAMAKVRAGRLYRAGPLLARARLR